MGRSIDHWEKKCNEVSQWFPCCRNQPRWSEEDACPSHLSHGHHSCILQLNKLWPQKELLRIHLWITREKKICMHFRFMRCGNKLQLHIFHPYCINLKNIFYLTCSCWMLICRSESLKPYGMFQPSEPYFFLSWTRAWKKPSPNSSFSQI